MVGEGGGGKVPAAVAAPGVPVAVAVTVVGLRPGELQHPGCSCHRYHPIQFQAMSTASSDTSSSPGQIVSSSSKYSFSRGSSQKRP